MEIYAEPSPHPERPATGDSLEYRLRQQRITADFGYFALKTHRLDELLQKATEAATLGMNAKYSKIMRHIDGGTGFKVVAGVGWRPGVVGHATVGDDLESPAGFAYHTGKAVISNHLANEDRFRTPSLLLEHGINRALNVIIRCDDERYGVLEVDSPSEGKFDEADVAFLESFAATLGVAMQRSERDARLERAAEHQQMLVHEISHRVKNSLSIVAGLLSMHARSSQNEDVRHALRDAGHRIQAVAIVHDRLWRNNSARNVDLANFLGELCGHLSDSTSSVEVKVEVPSTIVNTDQAVTVGLLVNELVTNAIKYAYEETGLVHVVVEAVDGHQVRLTVADDGRGLPPDFDPSQGGSLGLKLIRSLCAQLGGQPRWHQRSRGTGFSVEFVPSSELDPAL